jgi:hypothetical protein
VSEKTTDPAALAPSAIDALRPLLDDHRAIERLLDMLESADVVRARGIVEHLKPILTLHNATEEAVIYPALSLTSGNPIEVITGSLTKPRKLYFETAEADMTFFRLDEIVHNRMRGDFHKLALKLVSMLRAHIRYEELDAFPNLADNANPEWEQHLGDAVREFRSKLHHDEVRG